jgi:hypothetical protein
MKTIAVGLFVALIAVAGCGGAQDVAAVATHTVTGEAALNPHGSTPPARPWPGGGVSLNPPTLPQPSGSTPHD